MPLFEYVCESCGQRFEHLVRAGESPEACPRCEAKELRKLVSSFAVAKSSSMSFEASPCGTCGDPRGPGSCAFDN